MAKKEEKGKINLPNKLTILRMVLVPVFITLMAIGEYGNMPKMRFVSCFVFVFAALTDFLDGYLSRKNNQVTTFGKVMDPLADKLLVSSGFIMLTGLGHIPAVFTAIVILRDFLINAFRMFGSDKGVVIPAAWSGKVKTASQLTGLTLAILDTNKYGAFVFGSLTGGALVLNILSSTLINIAVCATIYSCIDYTKALGKYIDPTK